MMKNNIVQQGVCAFFFASATLQSHAASSVDFSNLVEQVSPAVVSVNVVKSLSQEELMQQQIPELLRRFFGNQVIVPQQRAPKEESAYGSAFFISKDGYLLTNHHVVENASRITITLNDRREIDAKVVGSDERTDVALLKVMGTNYPALKIGNVDKLRVGEPVLAIGSPFGFDYSASAGIVSAKSRAMSRESAVPFIQTDAALNPGNSGGPLFNQAGEVVGVNSRIFSGTGGYMGLSFSIPIDVAMDVAEQLKKTGKYSRGYLGVMLQDIDRNLAEAYKLDKPEGALVTEVSADSPAAKAGLKAGDVLLKYNGSNISRTSDLISLVNRSAPNQSVPIQVLRDDKLQIITVKLATAPEEKNTQGTTSNPSQGSRLGMSIRAMSPEESARFGRPGVIVDDVIAGSLAARSNLLPGDVITQIERTPVKVVGDFNQVLSKFSQSTVVRVQIWRQGQQGMLGLRLK